MKLRQTLRQWRWNYLNSNLNSTSQRRLKMKRRAFSAMSLTIVASLLIVPTFVFATRAKDLNKWRVKEIKMEKGKLKQDNQNIRAALAQFQKRGHTPKTDDATTFSGKVEEVSNRTVAASNSAIFRQASFRPQQTTISGSGVTMTFITTVDLTNEWQGTVIANFYDAYGTLEDQYVANWVVTRSEYNAAEWTIRYGVVFENGLPYLMHVPGMFAGFALGTPIMDHQAISGAPPPLNLESGQFTSPEHQQLYYSIYPEQYFYDTPPDQREGDLLLLPRIARAKGDTAFQTVRFSRQTRSDRPVDRPLVPPNPNGPRFVGGRAWAGATGAACAGAAGGCGLSSVLFAGVTFGPCFVSTCAGSAIAAAFYYIRVQPGH